MLENHMSIWHWCLLSWLCITFGKYLGYFSNATVKLSTSLQPKKYYEYQFPFHFTKSWLHHNLKNILKTVCMCFLVFHKWPHRSLCSSPWLNLFCIYYCVVIWFVINVANCTFIYPVIFLFIFKGPAENQNQIILLIPWFN